MGRSSEKSSLLASTSGSNNGRDHQRDAHRGGVEGEEKESTFQYLSSIVVSALALTGAVVGVASVWQRCQNGNCNPGSFLLPGDHRYIITSRARFLLSSLFFLFRVDFSSSSSFFLSLSLFKICYRAAPRASFHLHHRKTNHCIDYKNLNSLTTAGT